jgi:catechol-2,3-dioxygenase
MIHSHMYVLAVPDLERSAAFYRDVLGFEIHEMGNAGWRMRSPSRSPANLGRCANLACARSMGTAS